MLKRKKEKKMYNVKLNLLEYYNNYYIKSFVLILDRNSTFFSPGETFLKTSINETSLVTKPSNKSRTVL